MAYSSGADAAVVRRTGIPDGWIEARIRDLAKFVGGGTPPRDDDAHWRNGSVPWITPRDLTANGRRFITRGAEFLSEEGLHACNATLVPSGSVVFSTRGTVGSIAIAANSITCNQSCELLVPERRKVEPEFLYYLLDLARPAFLRLAGGTTFSSITRRDIGRVRVALPPDLDEQRAIARFLGAIDVAVERARDAIDNATELRRSLSHELLSRGIDESGRVRGEDANFLSTAAGLLPASWELSTVGAEFTVQSGFTINEARRPRLYRRPYLRVANVRREALDLEEVTKLDAHDDEFLARVLRADDLLVVEGHADRMQVGRCALVTEAAEGMTFQNHLFRLRTRGRVSAAFASLWLNSEYAQRYWAARCATSSGLQTINQRTLKRMLVPLLEEREEARMVDILRAQGKHIGALRQELDSLLTLRDSVLVDALSGRRSVRELEVAVAT